MSLSLSKSKTKGSARLLLSRKTSSFQEFFELGGEESSSPFLTSKAKAISRNVTLKSSCLAAVFLLASFLSVSLPLKTELHARSEYISLILLSFTYLLVGTPALISALEDIFVRKDVNIDVLMTLSAFGAMSLGRPLEGALLLVLFALSGSLEDLVTLKAKNALLSIHKIAPSKASVLKSDGSHYERSVKDIEVGTHILARTGEIVPLDGIVVSGSASISSAHLTGEEKPIDVGVGDKVSSGSRILQGSVTLKVTTTQSDSTVYKIVQLITEAQNKKPKLSQFFERFGRIYSLSVIMTTFGLMALFPLALNVPLSGQEGALVRSMSFLITASPCALFIAVPIAYLSSLGSSVRRGAILKGGTVFDRLLDCGCVAFDKTGTLTSGNFRLIDLIPLHQTHTDLSRSQILSIAASVEQHVVHPIAKAVVDLAKEEKLPFLEAQSVKVYAGSGVQAELSLPFLNDSPQEDDASLFNVRLHAATHEDFEEGVRKSAQASSGDKDQQFLDGASVVLEIHHQGKLCEKYLFLFEDSLRDESLVAVSRLKERGKKVLILSGDKTSIVEKIAKKLDISEWKADLKPQDKLSIISSLSSTQGRGLVMVGDGLNDAPALARATVGVSMGQLSSAAAREAADIVLLRDNLSLLDWLFGKALLTKKIVRQNLFLAIFSIVVGTTSSLFGVIPLWMAVLLHEGSTLLVGLNALRLLR